VTGRRGRALAIEYSLSEHSFRRIEKLLRNRKDFCWTLPSRCG
jgi:hypothetical protein